MKKEVSNTSKDELRIQAEAEWDERKKKTGPLPVLNADIRRLVHELEVHQIELEMQNEELMQVRAELEAALRQYTDLYDFSPVGYFTLARDSAILQVNLTGASLLGIERGKLAKRRFGQFVSEKSLPTINTFLEKVFKSGKTETCEIKLERDGLEALWVQIEAVYLEDGQTEACHAVMSDIAERKQAQEELEHLSTHDALTGLYNHGYFVEEMARLERGRQFPVSIMMADVDGLKNVNDQNGHAAGDALLIRVAQVLTAAFRAEDVVARIGGDEFAVLLPATSWTDVEVLLKRVRQLLEDDNSAYPETPIYLSLGVGTARHSEPLSDTLKEADAHMYHEKRGKDVS